MTFATPYEAMESSLLAIAETDIDIAPLLSARFLNQFPEHRAAFINPDAAWGRMTSETIEAMVGLATEESWVATSIMNFVDLHTNYGAFSAALYAAYIDMTIDVLAQAAGAGWTADADNAWRLQAERLKQLITQAISATS